MALAGIVDDILALAHMSNPPKMHVNQISLLLILWLTVAVPLFGQYARYAQTELGTKPSHYRSVKSPDKPAGPTSTDSRYYVQVFFDVGKMSTRNSEFFPAIHLNYQYDGMPGQLLYRDSMHVQASTAQSIMTAFGIEMGRKDGYFFGLDIASGTDKTVNRKLTMASLEIGYNLLGKRITLRPSATITYLPAILYFPNAIKSNGHSIEIANERFSYECGCHHTAPQINVGLDSRVTAANVKLGLDFTITPQILLQANAGYWVTLVNRLDLTLKSRVKEREVSIPSGSLNLNMSDGASGVFNFDGFFWNVAVIFRLKGTQREDRGYHHHHHSGSHIHSSSHC